jgi:hypothetical protein
MELFDYISENNREADCKDFQWLEGYPPLDTILTSSIWPLC